MILEIGSFFPERLPPIAACMFVRFKQIMKWFNPNKTSKWDFLWSISYLATSIGSLITHRRKLEMFIHKIQFQEIAFRPKAENRFKLTQWTSYIF